MNSMWQAQEGPISFNDNDKKRTMSEVDNATLNDVKVEFPKPLTPADIESQKVTQMNMAIDNKIHSFKMYLIPIISILFIGIIIILILLYLDNQSLKESNESNTTFIDLMKKDILSINQNLIKLSIPTKVELIGME